MEKSLVQKLEQSKMAIEDAFEMYPPEKVMIAWSAGKDSTLLLKLILDVCAQQKISPPIALDIDQNDQFDELMSFRSHIVDEWNVDLMIVCNDDFLNHVKKFGDSVNVNQLNKINQAAIQNIRYEKNTVTWESESAVCNHLLKTVPINQAIIDNDIQALFTGIRWDEHGARENEIYFSPREKPDHMRVHPLLHLTERDIWDSHFGLNIPYNELYQHGYRSLGTKSGTTKNSSIPAWEQDLENTNERGQRSAEKEKVMEQLRRWGYL